MNFQVVPSFQKENNIQPFLLAQLAMVAFVALRTMKLRSDTLWIPEYTLRVILILDGKKLGVDVFAIVEIMCLVNL
jgi:hypothetical protein